MNRSPHGRVRHAARFQRPAEPQSTTTRPRFLVELEYPSAEEGAVQRLLGPGVVHLDHVMFTVGVVEIAQHGPIYCLLDRETLTGELVVDPEGRGWDLAELGHLVPVLVGVAEEQGVTLCCTIGERATEERRQTVLARPARRLAVALPHARLDAQR